MAYIDAATGKAAPASIAAYSDGKPRPGYREILGDGEYFHFNIMCRDHRAGGAAVVLADSYPRQIGGSAVNSIASARNAWLRDKQTAYRTSRTDAPAPVQDRAEQVPNRAPSPASIRTARDAWLVDKANAYKGGR